MIQMLSDFHSYLIEREVSSSTCKKYLSAVRAFVVWMGDRPMDKAAVLSYKAAVSKQYAPATVNGILSALCAYFSFLGRPELRVKKLKIQRNVFTVKERELTRREYERLLVTAKKMGKERLCLVMQTVCATGIRVSELRFITVEAVKQRVANITNKGKTRRVFLPRALAQLLSDYIKKQKIKEGMVFVTRKGRPLDRSNIWADMKRLCSQAQVARSKVFPHNLRHLFARTFYNVVKDIVRLADILGHTSVDTTRIYTAESGDTHRRRLERVACLLC